MTRKRRAEICQNLPEFARICQNSARHFRKTGFESRKNVGLKFARICQNLPEFARICQNSARRFRKLNPVCDSTLKTRCGFKTNDDGVKDQTLPIFNVQKTKYGR